MSDMPLSLVRKSHVPDECVIQYHKDLNYIGTLRIQRYGLHQLLYSQSRDYVVMDEIWKSIPDRKDVIFHAACYDGRRIIRIEMRGNGCRLFIEADPSVPAEKNSADLKGILVALWGNDFGDCIHWT